MKTFFEKFDEKIPLRKMNEDNPQYVLGFNMCRQLCIDFIKEYYEKNYEKDNETKI